MLKIHFNFRHIFISFAIASLILGFSQFFTSTAFSAFGINRQINFQGKLVNNPSATNVSNTSYTVVFTLYDNASGSTALWTETQSVTTTDGIFRVALGSVTPIPANFNFNWSGLYLGMKVNSDSEMTPRIQMAAVPFAFNAEKVAGLTVQDASGNASTSGTLQVANAKTVKFNDAFTTANAMTFGSGTTGTITLGSSTNNLTFTTSGDTTLALPTSGTICTTTSCAISNWWNQLSGALSPLDTTNDFLIGSTATSSALFSYTGIKTGQTIASVSGQLVVMANNGYGGNVGIGISSPTSLVQAISGVSDFRFSTGKLAVTPSMIVINTSPSGKAGALLAGTDGSAFEFDGAGYFDIGYEAKASFTGNDLGTSTSVVRVTTNTSASVGINTGGSIYATLEVANTGAGNKDLLHLNHSSGFSTGDESQLSFSQGATVLSRISNYYSGSQWGLKFYTYSSALNATPALTILGNNTLGVNTTTSLATLDVRANLFSGGTIPVASVSGATSFAALVANNDGVGDLFTASSSGTNKFAIQHNGTIVAPTYQTCTLKTDGDGLFTCGTDNTGSGINWWNQLAGALSPVDITNDFLIGSTATSTAKFSFTGIKTGSTIASISGQLIVMPNNGYGGWLGIGVTNPNNLIQVKDLINFDATTSGTFLGHKTGSANSGLNNVFVGYQSGLFNTTGNSNNFLGVNAGAANTTGNSNNFLGVNAGAANTSGSNNSFLGLNAGLSNTTGTGNVLLGGAAGAANTIGSNNSFVGLSAGFLNSTGKNNSFMGVSAGNTNEGGGLNTVLGYDADFGSGHLINATALGARALVNQNDSLVLGSILGVNSATGSARIGIGTIAPSVTLDVRGFSTLNAGTLAVASISGQTSFAALVANNDGVGDLFTASSSGTNKFAIQHNGTIVAPTYQTCTLKTDGDGLFTCGTDNTGSGVNWWNQLAGALSPLDTTSDLLIGATSTSSALFSFTGVKTGNTIASVSGTLNVFANNGYGGNATISGALTLGAFSNPVIQTTKNQTLTIGGNTTGDIFFTPKNVTSGFYVSGNTGNDRAYLGLGTANPQFDIHVVKDDDLFVKLQTGPSFVADIVYNNGTQDVAELEADTNFNTFEIGTVANDWDLIFKAAGTGRMVVNRRGKVGVGTDVFNDEVGNGQFVVNQTNNFGTSGDIFSASAAGTTKFVIANNGKVTIGNSTDGLVFDPTSGGPTYSGAARPTKTITLSPEYAGAILTASGSANTTGSMTSDASSSANFRTYYEWSSTTASLQDYTVAVRITLPADFSAWNNSTSMQISYNTDSSVATTNKVDLFIYNPSTSTSTPVVYRQANVSTSWTTLDIANTDLEDSPAWNTAGQTAIIYLKMYASGTVNKARVGDIVLNYKAKF